MRTAPANPRELARRTEWQAAVPDSSWERFRGYGVMGLPFESGHVLALRRFSASSVGPGYASVWHRTPTGRWTFYSDVDPSRSCARYFSASVSEAITTEIEVDWAGPQRLVVTVPAASLEWTINLESTWKTDLMNAVAALLPGRMWTNTLVLSAVALVARRLLGIGVVGLWGRASNGHRFMANPRRIWMVGSSTASIRGASLGVPGPLPQQASLRDFLIPQRGIFALGDAYFDYPQEV